MAHKGNNNHLHRSDLWELTRIGSPICEDRKTQVGVLPLVYQNGYLGVECSVAFSDVIACSGNLNKSGWLYIQLNSSWDVTQVDHNISLSILSPEALCLSCRPIVPLCFQKLSSGTTNPFRRLGWIATRRGGNPTRCLSENILRCDRTLWTHEILHWGSRRLIAIPRDTERVLLDHGNLSHGTTDEEDVNRILTQGDLSPGDNGKIASISPATPLFPRFLPHPSRVHSHS